MADKIHARFAIAVLEAQLKAAQANRQRVREETRADFERGQDAMRRRESAHEEVRVLTTALEQLRFDVPPDPEPEPEPPTQAEAGQKTAICATPEMIRERAAASGNTWQQAYFNFEAEGYDMSLAIQEATVRHGFEEG